MKAFNLMNWILGVFLLGTTQGSKVDDICYKWSGDHLGDGFTVGQTDATICRRSDGKGDLVSDSNTCYGYYYCESLTESHSVGVWNHCPTDQHFDVLTGKCVSPENYPCVYNRCRNVKKPYMAVVNSGCTWYQLCATDVILKCPTEKPYFNEVIQSCVATKPAYKVCQWDMG